MSDIATTTIVNTEMAAIWDGEEGDEWTENAERYDATDRWIAERFDAEVAIGASDHVLDIGCGTGKSTRTAARRADAGMVLGVDLSTRMLAYARRRSAAEGLSNVSFLRADAESHPLGTGIYDIAISTFGTMFFTHPVAAFANIGRSLRPGGAIAFIAWQPFEANRWLTAIVDAVSVDCELPVPVVGEPGPFGLADREVTLRLLDEAGFTGTAMTPLATPLCLGSDVGDAMTFLCTMGLVRGLLDGLAEHAEQQALENLHELVTAHETPDGVLIDSATWLITGRAS